jgi:transcription elongation factor GreB
MSKAFNKETDAETAEEQDAPDPLPPNTRNYMTPGGFDAMQEELRRLLREERPKVVETVAWAAGNGDRSENGDYIYGKKRLREIDRRARYLAKRLESASVVDPKLQQKNTRVFFGATVTYVRENGEEKMVTLVGIDEADADQGKISWQSPVARALFKAEVGDKVTLHTPLSVETLEVTALRYGV